MRSRFAAYALKLPDYIIQTTHPASPQYSDNISVWKHQITQFSLQTTFEKLEIFGFEEKDNMAVVSFTAHLLQNLVNRSFSEKSFFEKMNGRWLYHHGIHKDDLLAIQAGDLNTFPITFYGTPILRQKAAPVKEITDEVKNLVKKMTNTLYAFNGMGLAAPQVHHSIRLFIIRLPEELEDGTLRYGELKVFINPKLSLPSKETRDENEGCLSIPGIRHVVERPQEITVEYTNLDGATTVERFSGWTARVIMHENDHINGILFIDRLPPKEKAKLENSLKKLEKRLKP